MITMVTRRTWRVRPVEHCIRQASTGQAKGQAAEPVLFNFSVLRNLTAPSSRMADCLHLRGKFELLTMVGI